MSIIVAILKTSKNNKNIRISKKNFAFIYYLRFLDIYEDVELLTKLGILAFFGVFGHFLALLAYGIFGIQHS